MYLITLQVVLNNEKGFHGYYCNESYEYENYITFNRESGMYSIWDVGPTTVVGNMFALSLRIMSNVSTYLSRILFSKIINILGEIKRLLRTGVFIKS